MSPLFTRASAIAAVVCATAVAAAPASARMYVSTSKTVDAAGNAWGYVEGYAYGGASDTDPFKLDVVRDGATVASADGVGYVWTDAVVPRAGDRITLTDVATSESQTTTYTGNPRLADTVCGAPTKFTGTRDAGATVTIRANVFYGVYDARTEFLSSSAPIAGPGTTFSGSFGKALSPKWDVRISQINAISNALTALSDTTRAVGGCPPAPPVEPPPATPTPVTPTPPAVVKDVLPPHGALLAQPGVFKAAAAYRALLAGTFVNRVAVTEPGVVTQTLYLDDGATLPKATAAAKKKAKAKKLTALGTGRVAVAKAGTVKVKVKLSKKGKSRLKRSRTVKLALVTVITDASGNARVLPPKKFTVKRTKATK